MNSGDISFVLVSAALVMLMVPGLAFFYGGLVRRKNVLGVLMQCFAALCVVTVQWVLFGYSLAFAPGSPFIGGLQWVGLQGVGLAPYADYSATIPHILFVAFQMMFAVLTPAIIAGGFAERMKFSSFLVFTLAWTTFVYDPICHWVWAVGGWVRTLGALDFAGGTVVHISSGFAALAVAMLIGKRIKTKGIPPHNLPLSVLGAGILWFGWFGFNAGSALGAGSLAASAFMVTHVAAAAAGASWFIFEWIFNKKPTILGSITGAVAGLVAITPAAGFVSVLPALIIGFAGSLVCFVAVTMLKPLLGYDDSLDAFGIHGIGGAAGALLTGVFASKAVNSAGAEGLIHGNAPLITTQLIAVGVTAAYAFIATAVIYKVIDWTMGMRVSEKHEDMGLDLSQHQESAYTVLE